MEEVNRSIKKRNDMNDWDEVTFSYTSALMVGPKRVYI